jgi:pimeloyl-ACP methyl ester carboxylesterase
MKGLQPPPKEDTPSRIVARILTLVILVSVAGVIIFTAVTNQQADLIEDIRGVGLELDNPSEVNGFTINVAEDPGGPAPVVLLHDVDAAGGLTLRELSASLGDGFGGVRVDLPGFGFSDRLPFEGPSHTSAGMADVIAGVLEDRFDAPVLVVGVGLGGKVGAELAHTYPTLVRGLVMVDVDFWAGSSWVMRLERFPWVGKAATYTWETGGRFALGNWAPYCDSGGWCPSPEQVSQRSVIIEIENTTESMYRFRRTREAALAPGNLDEIVVPMAYVWSTEGVVPRETVDRLVDEAPGLTVVESSSFQAHLEDHAAVRSALEAIGQ